MVQLSPAAYEELREAILYYETTQPGTGERFSLAVDAAIDAITQAPKRFAKYEGG